MYDNARRAVTWFSIIRLVFSLVECFMETKTEIYYVDSYSISIYHHYLKN